MSKNFKEIFETLQSRGTRKRMVAAWGVDSHTIAAAAKADVASSLDDAAVEQVKGIKVNDAAHADNADEAAHATDADKLGGIAAADYATKAYADQAEADALAAAKEHVTGVIADYYTKAEAETQFMDSTETSNAIDAKITALNLGATYEPIGAETRAKAYADGLAVNYDAKGAAAAAEAAAKAYADGLAANYDAAGAACLLRCCRGCDRRMVCRGLRHGSQRSRR